MVLARAHGNGDWLLLTVIEVTPELNAEAPLRRFGISICAGGLFAIARLGRCRDYISQRSLMGEAYASRLGLTADGILLGPEWTVKYCLFCSENVTDSPCG